MSSLFNEPCILSDNVVVYSNSQSDIHFVETLFFMSVINIFLDYILIKIIFSRVGKTCESSLIIQSLRYGY